MGALLIRPADAVGLLVLAHGAGAGMRHAFMQAICERLAGLRVATLRFEFGYMAAGGRAPDRAPKLVACVRDAVQTALEVGQDLPVFVGGKSMGGRMSSLAQAEAPLEGVSGIVFLGFPLHAAGKPGRERATHLAETKCPLLFVQGTRDKLAELELLAPIVEGLGSRATLHVVDGGDHSFHVLKRSGRRDEEVLDEVAECVAQWISMESER